MAEGFVMMKRKTRLLLPILCLALLFLASPHEADAGAGTTGKVSVGVSSIILNTPVAIKCYSMTASADYAIVVSGTTWINWTNGAAETSKVFYKTFDTDDVSNDMIKIELTGGAAAAVDTLYLYESEVEDWFPTDFIFDLFVPILIAVILVGVVIAFRVRRRGR